MGFRFSSFVSSLFDCLTGSYAEFASQFPALVEVEETVAPTPSQPSPLAPSAPLPSPAKVKITNLEPTLILPGLYIGAKKDATNAETLAALNIACIVNVTKDCPNAFPSTIEYLQIPVDVGYALLQLSCPYSSFCFRH